MRSWTLLDTARIPGSPDELRLLRRGGDYVINIGREMLMGSRTLGSERALAELGCRRLAGMRGPRVLIGGFGMGFTLQASLAILPASAVVVVAELVPTVIAWGRSVLAPLSGNSLDDARVIVHEGDVGDPIRSSKEGYDAILLDVDNGPEALTRSHNERLYDAAGLHAARTALRPRGALCVWSAAPDAAFSKRLTMAGFAVQEVGVRAHAGKGRRHLIWVATR